MKNHRKPWTFEEETAFAQFMLDSIRSGNKVNQALQEASIQFGRHCEDRWKRYGLGDLYAVELKEAKRISVVARRGEWSK